MGSPHFEEPHAHQLHAPTNRTNQRALQQKVITRIVAKLPFQLRESVTSVIEMAMASAGNMENDLDICYHEIAMLRSDLQQKSGEATSLKKTCGLYMERVRGLEENVEILRDNIDSRQKFSIKNKSAITRLASTNRMLIDALDALQSTTNTEQLVNSKSTRSLVTERRPGLLLPISKNKKGTGTHKEYEDGEQKVSTFQNDKLRESLLRVAREHYRSMKNSELLDTKVLELRASLRSQEQTNRKLKSELDEMRILATADSQAEEVKGQQADMTPSAARKYHFGSLDERFQGYLDKNAFDPIDGIMLLRRIIAHMAAAPADLDIQSMINHVASVETQKIFESDMVSFFLKDPVRSNVLLRYTVKSKKPEEIDIETRCVAADVIRTGKVSRLNVLSPSTSFNIVVDNCAGVVAKRLMSLPIYDADSSNVLGCVHITNKNRNDLFSESDEIFGLLFADQVSLLLTSCVRYDSMERHSQMLQHLLEASTALFSVIPDTDSLSNTRPLEPGQILQTLETLAREILKCPTARAFLVSDFCGLQAGELVMLEPKSRSGYATVTIPRHSGIAGHVVETRAIYQLDQGFDPYTNPLVDLDPINSPLVTVPILDLYGTVVGCLELVVGPRSPKLRELEENKIQRALLFVQAAQWLTHQIAAPLQYLIKSVGTTVERPISTPSHIRTRVKGHAHFFSSELDLSGEDAFTSLAPPPLRTFPEEEPKPPTPGSVGRVSFTDQAELTAERDGALSDLAESRIEVGELHGQLHDAEALIATLQAGAESGGESAQRVAELEDQVAVLSQAKASGDEAVALDSALKQQAVEAAAQMKDELETITAARDELAAANSGLITAMSDLTHVQSSTAAELAAAQVLVSDLQREREERSVADANAESAPKDAPADAPADAPVVPDNPDISGDGKTQELEKQLAVHAAQLAASEAATREAAALVEEWKASYAEMEKSYLEYKTYSETQQAENSTLRAQQEEAHLAAAALSVEVAAEVAAAESQRSLEVTAMEGEREELKARVEALLADVAKKDAIQAILQQQVVRLAGQNIKDIDSAMGASQATAPTAPAPPALAVSDPPLVEPESVEPDSAQDPESAQESVDPAPTPKSPAPPMSRAPSASGINRPPGAPLSRAPSQRAPSDAEGGGWVPNEDEYGRTYFYNEQTGESSWSNPDQPPLQRGEWVRHFDDSGQEYWVNGAGESAWEVSEDGVPVVHVDEEEDVGTTPPAPSPTIYDTTQSQYSASAGGYTIEI
eukprot:CAMPEP_0173341404 /NCGR_PEP_ID=MMETSP1144-20121109/9553_1 /TAXON_ID=483371 /ORGANISM="non described non described, Strain CCMP2298" /LENGTH=1248 /DNA_ID=CAMNT_0014287723 /DNA_START=121 /DNA_END=3867 /DNA_ORIENTATION=-